MNRRPDNGSPTRRAWLLVTACLLGLPGLVSAAEETGEEEETNSPPPCEYCVFEQGEEGSISLGAGLVSDDNYHYGQYRGLDEEGAYLILDLDWQSVTEDGRRMEVRARDLGIDGRSLDALYERQGSYGFRLDYNEIPRSAAGFGARTPFVEQSGYDNSLGLPSGWMDAGTVAGMPTLANDLRGIDLSTQRRRVILGIDLDALDDWEFDVEFRHDEKDGTSLRAASFLTNAMQLPLPRDFTTDDMEASASYRGESFTAQFGYYLSTFTNTHSGLYFENPFTPITGGADRGVLSLEPDNDFHQLSGAFGWRFGDRSMLHLRTAFGNGSQDHRFLPVTTNSLLATSVLPRNSLQGDVDTASHHARYTTRFGSDVSLQANLRRDSRDNETPPLTVTPAITETYIGNPVTSTGYDFDRTRYDVSMSWRPVTAFRLRGALERKEMDRTRTEREETTEDIAWLEARVRPFERVGLQLRYLESERDGSTVIYDEPGALEENPLLRRFHVANREREAWRVAVDYDPVHWLLFTAISEFREDRYPDSLVGVTYGESRYHSLDASVVASNALRFSAFASYDFEQTRQLGSESFGQPDWNGRTRDDTRTSGLSAHYAKPETPWDFRMTISISEFEGETDVDTWVDATPFPDLVAQLYRTEFRYRYHFESGNVLTAGYVYEEYDARNWQLDGADVASVPTYLSMGLTSPTYEVNVVSVSYQWRF
ncbi:MAG: MtrB/PioB family decaheme-associated outer membrane protein [Gammaproteobacteria bacterium]|nr:MtrB/PioB family decaheme-associated outer membrane protein [Gammaproteobacteria bacterium]